MSISRAKLGASLGAVGIGAAVIIGESVLSRATDASLDKILPADDGGLLVNVEYPLIDEWCGTVDLGIPPSAPEPDTYNLGSQQELRQELIRQGAKPVGNGEAVLRLTMPPQEVAYVVDIRAVVFERDQPAPAWRYQDSYPCGGPVGERTFFVDLDQNNPRVVDLGVDRMGQDDPTVPQESLGREFTVSEADPMRVNVIGMSCETSVSWGLEIEYIQQGQSKTATVATPNEPFVIYGSDVTTYWPKTGSGGYGSGSLEAQDTIPANPCSDLSAS